MPEILKIPGFWDKSLQLASLREQEINREKAGAWIMDIRIERIFQRVIIAKAEFCCFLEEGKISAIAQRYQEKIPRNFTYILKNVKYYENNIYHCTVRLDRLFPRDYYGDIATEVFLPSERHFLKRRRNNIFVWK